jgi:ribosomal protein S6
MKHYEISYRFSQDLPEEEAKSISEKIISYLQENGGILKENREPLKQGLIYSIEFFTDPKNVETIENNLKLHPQIKKHLVIFKKEYKAITRRRRVKTEEPELKVEKKPEEKKVELKEIEKKLEEILGE